MAPPETSGDQELAASEVTAPASLAAQGSAGRARAADPSALSAAVPRTPRHRPYWLNPLLALIALSIALGGAGLVSYYSAKESLTSAVASNLESVARLKSLQIDHWLENAFTGLMAAIDSPQFEAALQDWENDGERDGVRRARLLELLERVAATSHYVGVELRSARDGSVLLATSDIGEADDASKALAAASAQRPVLDDFHVDGDEDDSAPRLRVGSFYPCRTKNSAKALGVIHAELDPTDILAQLAEEWPGLSRSAVTNLVRRDGSDVVFLNRVRDLPGSKPMMRMPLSQPDFVAATAVVRGSGYLTGLDYTNKAVLAYALRISGTPWFFVAQIDQAEVYEKIRTIAALAATAIGAVLALGCGGWAIRSRYLIARRQADFEVRKLETERADNMQRIAETSRRVVDVQELERRRLSGELHDLVGANLAGVDLLLATLARSSLTADAVGRQALLNDGRDLLRETITQVREFSSDLRPVVLDAGGVVPALEEAGSRFIRRTGIPVDFVNDGLHGRLSALIETVVFRVAQEALTNCAKHANAKHVSIRLSKTAGRLELEITDDGDGFELAAWEKQTKRNGSFGLVTMRERAEFAGGRLFVASKIGVGTRVCLIFDDVGEV